MSPPLSITNTWRIIWKVAQMQAMEINKDTKQEEVLL